MAKGKDMESKEKGFNDRYKLIEDENGYIITQDGIDLLLEDYWNIKEMGTYSYDPSVIFLRADFERALRSVHMTEQGRLSISLIYGMQLTYKQASKLMHIKVSEVKEEVEEAKEVIEAVMNGYKSDFYHKKSSESNNLDEWIQEVMNGGILPFDIPDKVNTSLLNYLSQDRDCLAAETLKQKREGLPIHIENEIFGTIEYNPENYPFHETAETIENPSRKRDYRIGDNDYFKRQDQYYGIGFTKEIEKLSRGLTVIGKRTIDDVTEENKNSNGKGLIYRI